MTGRTKLIAMFGACLLVVSVVSCQVAVTPTPGGGGSITATLAGLSFTFSFGPAGVIDVRANETVTQAGALRLFDEDPVGTPPSGTMTLLGTDVGVARLLTGKDAVRAQGAILNGTATVRFYIAAGSSAALCDTATFLAEYELIMTAGAVSVVDEVYELSQAALAQIVENDVTICIEVTADFDGQITFIDFSFSFGGGTTDTGAFTMVNSDTMNIHILLPGEDFDLSNRITPGNTRQATVTGLAAGDAVVVRAGRNGQVLDSTTCPAVVGVNYTAYVEWDGWVVTCDAEQSGGGGGTIPVGTTIQVPIDAYGDMALLTDVYDGIDYALVGVLNVNSSTQYPPNLPSNITNTLGRVDVDLAELGLQYVERIYYAPHAAWVPELPDGLTIATLTCDYAEGGAPTVLDLTLGSTTAEWSHSRPDHDIQIPGGVGHAIIPILYSFETVSIMGYEYLGHIYSGNLALDTTRTLSSFTLELVDPNTYLDLRTNAPGPPTWSGQGVLAITLVGPAGIPSGGGGTTGTGTLTGQVVDAQTGSPLVGATVAVSGTALSTTTDASGNFTITGVPEGGQTIVATLTGYVETSVPTLLVANGTSETTIGMLALGAGGDNVAAVLAWGEDPRDLDLHMSGPDGSGGRFHAYYSSKSPVPHVFLDLDDTSSFGPETMTVQPTETGAFVPGDYHVWIHHYAGDLTFAESTATVTLFAAGAQIAQYTVGGASGDSSQRIWQVVEFSVSATGAVSNVSVQQSFTEGAASSVF